MHKCFSWNRVEESHPACEIQQTGMGHTRQRKRMEEGGKTPKPMAVPLPNLDKI
ncbi:hypothetical protein HMPREF1199_01397 [Hoylesella oralis CC98A]|nr:hypothetical protein HMPREF1199_01397 [Hoylesella oralis CC98A]